ncbi:hypothetical protein SDC9_131922 [bioreactor metagenome]|uniref:Uncharacterized protein n=1 Tax=bioreactor metagenome TaxID=1076179 RepID=A0A645D657_9ZZZZ
MFDYTGFQIVWCDDSGDAAKEAVRINMSGNPSFLFHIQESFHIGVTTVGQYGNEYIGFDSLSRIGIHKIGRLASPVHLQCFTRFMLQVHSRFCLVNKVCIVLIKLRGFVG